MLPPRGARRAAPLPSLRSALALATFALLGACAGARPGPVDAVQSYVSALRDGRLADAYGLLSSETRRVLSFDEFARLARDNPDELRETARWLEQVDPRAPVTARLELPSGEVLTLFEEGGTWRLDPAALDFYGQRTPRQALRSFVRALSRRRWDVLLRFAPARIAATLTPEQLRASWERGAEAREVQRMLTTLSAQLDRPIEVSGDRATMQYGVQGRYVAQLVREDGVWKVESPN